MDAVITTLRDRCRRCYACVRNCPAKAIRVRDGQAEVLVERCVACGRCVGVCSQGAKQVARRTGLDELFAEAPGRVLAIVAPSFPAAFPDWRPGQVVAALRRLGFAGVHEVAFGADMVSRAYQQLHAEAPDRLLITTPCPAAYGFIQKYAVELLPHLAPVLSPMAAIGRLLKEKLRPGCRTVFVGPCTAKLREVREPEVTPWVDFALTFPELTELLAQRGIDPGNLDEELFDGPHSLLGGAYPVPGGLLRAADLPCDLLDGEVATVAGGESFLETVERLRQKLQHDGIGRLEARFFDVLFCRGCIGGPGMPRTEGLIMKKQRITSYLRDRRERPDRAAWEREMAACADVALERGFPADPQPTSRHTEEAIHQVLAQTGKLSPRDELNCGACGYRTCRDKAVAVLDGIAEREMCLPHLIERLQATIGKLNRSHEDLQEAQTQLLRAERLASMGQLAAGIAHELNNPLGSILIYAHLLREGAVAGSAGAQIDEDAGVILREATRCRGIVAGLLDFARQNKVNRQPVDVRALLDEAVDSVRVQVDAGRYTFRITAPPDLPEASLDRDQIKQVLVNLVRNAVEAMPAGGNVDVEAEHRTAGDELVLRIRDAGTGIAEADMHKLFSPFFTTKPVGKGTGLGLPICYGIVKMHRGTIVARNNAPSGPGAVFEIVLPAAASPAPAPMVGDELPPGL
jgi:signal transduction histidine kinase/iron only hydrogenase large subunit-like protein